jgi:hypothetical protein
MKFPQGSTDVEAAKERLHEEIGRHENMINDLVSDLATTGLFDKRWCAIAKTHFDEGFMALHRSIRDYPGDDPNQYGKVPMDKPMPESFNPPVDPTPEKNIGSAGPSGKIEWHDYRADGDPKPDDDRN